MTYLTKRGRQFRVEVCEDIQRQLTAWEPLTGRLAVSLELTPPTRRRLDIDNFCKSTLDALCRAGLFLDDEQIDMLIVKRLPVEAPGCCDVVISELERKAEP